MFKQSRPKKLFLLTNLWLLLALVFSISLAGLFNQAGHNRVEAATSSTINFQARLLSNSGALVPDGFYNAQFKLYSASSGGTAQWTETYYDSNGVTAGNDNRVRVVNGYLSVYLGSQTALPSIDWSQEEWLTINIGGTTQTATPTWDGEMSPRLKLSAVPYALTAGTLAKTTGANTSTLDWDTQTGANSILLPDESGTLCIQGSSNCGFATASGSGSYIQNGTSIQTAANFAIQSAASGSVGGVIQAAVGQTADIFRIEDSSGNALFAVGSSGGGLLKRSSTSQSALALKTISDTANRLNIQAGGTIEWGDGTNPTDTNLYRSAAGQLTTDGELIVADNLSTWGDFWADQTISSGDQICASQTGTAAEEVCIGNNIGPSFQAGIQIGGDTSIYRSAATTLNTDGSLVVGTAGTSHGLTVNGLLGSATFDTDGNGLYFSRDGSNYIEATDALGTLRLGAGGNSNNVVLGTNGDILFQNSTDSTAAFQVQGTGDQALLTVDTQNGQTIIRPPSGSGSGVGKLVINSNWTDGSGDEAQLLFGEAADVGASAGKLYYTGVNNTVHLSGLDASGVTHDVLTFDRSGAGVILQSTNTVNINSTGANNITLAPAGTTNTGVVVKPGVDSTKAFQVQYSDSTPLFTVDTQNGEVGIGTAGSLAGNELYVQSNSDTVIRGKNTGTADLLQLANSSANVFVVNNSGNLTTAGDIQIQGGDLTTNQTTFNLLAGATTALNIGPGSNTATSINLAGGSGATGCTVAGATGNLTCSGTISTTNTSGTVGFWTRNNGTALLQPATTGDSIRISNAGGELLTLQSSAGGTYLDSQSSTSNDWLVTGKVLGDANQRYILKTNGEMQWGGGTSAPDIILTRSGAGALNLQPTTGNNSATAFTIQNAGGSTLLAFDNSLASGRLVIGGTGTSSEKLELYRGDTTTANGINFTTHFGTDWTIGQASGTNDFTFWNDNLNQNLFNFTEGGTLQILTPTTSTDTPFEINPSDGGVGSTVYLQINNRARFGYDNGVITIDDAGTDKSFNLNLNGHTAIEVQDTGSTTIQTASGDDGTAFQVQNSSGSDVFNVDTANLQSNVIGDLNVGDRFGSRLFSDSFESGGFGLWEQGTDGDIDISTSTVHDGKYSAELDPSGTDADATTNIAPESTVYLRAWVNVTSQTTSNADLLSLGNTDDSAWWTVYRNSASGGSAQLWNDCTGSFVGSGPNNFTTGTWHLIEMRITTGAGTGTSQVWFDGTQIINATSQNNCSQPISQVGIGDTSGRTFTAYVDDLSADTVTNGTASSLNVDDSFHVGGTTSFGSSVILQSDSSLALQVMNSDGDSALSIDNLNGLVTFLDPNVGIGASANFTDKLFVQSGAYNVITGNATGSNGLLKLQNNGSAVLSVGNTGNITAGGSATATTKTTEATARNNVTTVTLTSAGFANNDVIRLTRSGTFYYTRIVSGGGTTSLTVSPAVSYDASSTVTKYNVQYLGNNGSTFTGTTRSDNSYFQGYFTGGIVTGTGSTTYSDGNINSTHDLKITAPNINLQNSSDSTTAFLIQNASGDNLFVADTSGSSLIVNQGTLSLTGLAIPSSLSVGAGTNTGGSLSGATTYYYRVSAVTAAGESVPAGEQIMSAASFTPVNAPGSALSRSATGTGAISCDASAGCTYEVTFVTVNGETTAGPASTAILSQTGKSMNLTSIPTGATGTIARNIYIKSLLMFGDNNYHLEATINNNTSTSMTDDGSGSTASCYNCQAPPGSNTARTDTNKASLSWTAVSGATGYKVYRGTTPGQENTLAGSPSTNSYIDTGSGSAGTPSPSGGIKIGSDSEIYHSDTNTLTANSGLVLQATSNTSKALQVLNTSSQNILQVDTSGNAITLGTVNTVGTSGTSSTPGTPPIPAIPDSWGSGGSASGVGVWGSATSFPYAVEGATSFAYDGYIYVMGGYAPSLGGVVPYIFSAPIGGGGALGSWTYVGDMPDSLYGASTVVKGDYVYEIGGSDCNDDSCPTTTVYSAHLASGGGFAGDGNYTTDWNYTGDLFDYVMGASAAVDDGYIYVMGGFDGSSNVPYVFTAEITPDGLLDNGWNYPGDDLPVGIYGGNAIVYNGHIYQTFGSTANDSPSGSINIIYGAALNGDGTLGSWTSSSGSDNRVWANSISYGGYMYELSGYNGGTGALAYITNECYTYSGPSMSAAGICSNSPPEVQQATAVAYNGYIYQIGGSVNNFDINSGSSSPTTAVSYATVAGTADVIGQAGVAATSGSPGTPGTPSSAGNAVNLRVNGNGVVHSNTNSTTAFEVQNATGTDILAVDTTNSLVKVDGVALQGSTANGSIAIGRTTVMATGNNDASLGYQALQNSSTSSQNTAVGAYAAYNTTIGNYNTANGYQALYNNTSGFANTAIGAGALSSITTGQYNVAVGYNALQGGGTGNGQNVGIGSFTSIGASTSNSIAIGYNASVGSSLTNATAIGSSASVTASNSLVLGNGAKVGIGISNPGFKLDVQDNQSATYVAQIRNTNTGTNADGLLINLGIANASRNANNYFVGFAGAGTVAGKIQGGASAVVYTTTGADYAEYFLAANPNDKPQAGEIVSLSTGVENKVQRAHQNDNAIVGVISESPGFLGNGPLCAVDDDNCDSDYAKTNVTVGMTGQLPVKVSAENGAIAAGDPITTGTTPGVGVKATKSGQIVGYAMQAFNGTGEGTVRVNINPGYYNAENQPGSIQGSNEITLSGLNVTGNASFNELTADVATIGQITAVGATITNLDVNGTATIATLHITADSVFDGDLTLNAHIITGIFDSNTQLTTEVTNAAGTDIDSNKDGTCDISGNDTSGTITLTTGTQNITEGAVCKITFIQPFTAKPRTIISALDKDSVQISAFITSTKTDFTLNFINVPDVQHVYKFNYWNPQ